MESSVKQFPQPRSITITEEDFSKAMQEVQEHAIDSPLKSIKADPMSSLIFTSIGMIAMIELKEVLFKKESEEVDND